MPSATLPACVPETWKRQDAVSVLAVSPHEDDRARLREIFDSACWSLRDAESWPEAFRLMENGRCEVVLADNDMPGGWRRMLADVGQLPGAPLLIVTSRLADNSLWAEVLNEGGHDVLATPFDHEEVVRVISAACRRSQNHVAHTARES